MNFTDLLGNPNPEDGELDSQMTDMDITLNYDNPDLMSSEFFDSVLSLEQANFGGLDYKLDEGLLNVFEDEANLSSESSSPHSHSEEVFSPHSYTSESDKTSVYTEIVDLASPISNVEEIDFLSVVKPEPKPVDTQKAIVTTTTPKVNQVQPKGPTKIMIQNPNNRKLIIKPLSSATQVKKPVKPKQQVLRVQSLSGNGRSVLLPFNVQSIQILNPNEIKRETIEATPVITTHSKRRKVHSHSVSSSEGDDTNLVTSTESEYPALNLTNEEKRLLAKEGIQLPSHYPLTKNEERELKRIRRKIRNKISAQDSRKRKKEYVDGLEQRVKRGSEERIFLLQRIKMLQKQNNRLVAQLSKLQSLLFNSSTSKASPTTCLMIVLLSALLVSLPNVRLPQNKEMPSEKEQSSARRSLLSQQAPEDDVLNMEEFLVFNKDEEMDFENKYGAFDVENITDKEFSRVIEEMEVKYGEHCEKNCSEKDSLFKKLFDNVKNFLNTNNLNFSTDKEYGGYQNSKGFIEPDIDATDLDGEPPTKRVNFGNYIPVMNELDKLTKDEIDSTSVNTRTVIIANAKEK